MIVILIGTADEVAICETQEACMMVVVSQGTVQLDALHVSSGLLMALELLLSRLMHVCTASKRTGFVVLRVEAGLAAVVLVSVGALCMVGVFVGLITMPQL